MNMQQVRAIAKNLGLKTGNLTKAELIRTIQRQEGNFDCFGSANGFCDQSDCIWREECLNPKK